MRKKKSENSRGEFPECWQKRRKQASSRRKRLRNPKFFLVVFLFDNDLVFFSDLKQIAETAKKLKQKEIILARHFESEKELAELKQSAKREKLAVKFCHLLETQNEKELVDFEGKADFFALRGGTIALNRLGASSKRIDFLLQPAGNQRLEFDSALANTARENNVAVCALFSCFLNANNYDLVSLFRNYFLLAKICKKAKAQLNVFSGAARAEEMRSAADLQSFLELLKQADVDEETD